MAADSSISTFAFDCEQHAIFNAPWGSSPAFGFASVGVKFKTTKSGLGGSSWASGVVSRDLCGWLPIQGELLSSGELGGGGPDGRLREVGTALLVAWPREARVGLSFASSGSAVAMRADLLFAMEVSYEHSGDECQTNGRSLGAIKALSGLSEATRSAPSFCYSFNHLHGSHSKRSPQLRGHCGMGWQADSEPSEATAGTQRSGDEAIRGALRTHDSASLAESGCGGCGPKPWRMASIHDR
jgi:hypothetical protein